MSPGPGEIDALLIPFVDEEPIGRDMAFPIPDEVPFEFVVPVLWVERFFLDELRHDLFEEGGVEAALLRLSSAPFRRNGGRQG